jgi:hypothetical protein
MIKISTLLFICFISHLTFAQQWKGAKRIIDPSESKAAGCVAPKFSQKLELNNVRALVHTAGNLWHQYPLNDCIYEVPKNSGIMALFTSALWLGGTDVNNQLKLAAIRYRDGQDYFTGPLTPGAANISPDECQKFDKQFNTKKNVIRQFVAWYDAGQKDQLAGTNTQATGFPNYKIPEIIKNWPAHGDIALGQDYYLAPFFDRNNDGNYDWDKGDYPWFDVKNTLQCKVDRKVTLFGDENFWWVMNDKGNTHTESGAEPIGMEIRAQAFAFNSDDQINDMTFYNYELINRGTQTLFNTYFGIFVDGALGNPNDDFVGCDVNRGLAYNYNGNAFDGSGPLGFLGYGANPPAVGVDFFEGPYQDNDQIDNAVGIGPNEALNGIGFGDGIVDNERYGMRKFLYFNNLGCGGVAATTDPTTAVEYYKMMRGIWKDNSLISYGGRGHISDPNTNANLPADFVFPGGTDTLGWGTGGSPQAPWTEITAGNTPCDRRTVQAAGPFILRPGAVNNITVGVCWSRSGLPNPFSSVESLFVADDKAQALFDNCFRIIDGPNAPEMAAQELDKAVVLTLSNPAASNNAKEDYEEFDPFIATSVPNPDKTYNFQGYQIFQLVNDQVGLSDLNNIELARQVAQCDVVDNVGKIINFESDALLEGPVAKLKVAGSNQGIQHSFLVTTDLFASGENKNLVNFKTYYYIAISYAHNDYLTYVQNDPSSVFGQKKSYLSSRQSAFGAVEVITVVPHKSAPEQQGTVFSYNYGFIPEITRLDGTGNGNRDLALTTTSEEDIVRNGFKNDPVYKEGSGPFEIKVIDPLNVTSGYFECKFDKFVNSGSTTAIKKGIDTASYTIYRYDEENGNLLESISSDQTIKVQNEQLIPSWGVSVIIHQSKYTLVPQATSAMAPLRFPEPISSGITFADSSKKWLAPITDSDINYPTNWILSGPYVPTDSTAGTGYNLDICYGDVKYADPEQKFEKIWDGGLAPFTLVANSCDFAPIQKPSFFTSYNTAKGFSTLVKASSIDIVFTKDKSKWTKCAVIELGSSVNFNVGAAEKGTLRKSLSVNKEGLPDGSGTFGSSWFPGYAIDIETGARLQMAFGENSALPIDNGADMIWNPSSTLVNGNGNPILGGQHPIYVFGIDFDFSGCSYYDEANNWVYDNLKLNTNSGHRSVYSNLMWVCNSYLKPGQTILASDARISARINKEYATAVFSNKNNGNPMYSWTIKPNAFLNNSTEGLQEAMDLINVVPNPYYAYSEYERGRLDTKVKLINLPSRCKTMIYNVSGKLVKSFVKDNEETYKDWNMQNEEGVPVASGTYLIHIETPEGYTKILKLFIAVRKLDTQNF